MRASAHETDDAVLFCAGRLARADAAAFGIMLEGCRLPETVMADEHAFFPEGPPPYRPMWAREQIVRGVRAVIDGGPRRRRLVSTEIDARDVIAEFTGRGPQRVRMLVMSYSTADEARDAHVFTNPRMWPQVIARTIDNGTNTVTHHPRARLTAAASLVRAAIFR